MFPSEGPAASAFQIAFKPAGGYLFPKGRVEDQFPWQVFPGVGRVASIMLVEAMSQIMGEPRVSLSWICNAAEEIDHITARLREMLEGYIA